MTKRIGFCCKWIDTPEQMNGFKPRDDAKRYNTGTTTITWLNRQTRAVAEQKLWDLMCNNLNSTRLLLERVSKLEDSLKMVRLSSDILAAFTEPTWSYFYRRPDVVSYCEREFGRIGDFARSNDIRVSFHPGQFCVLASSDPGIVNRSIEEFEYHATMAAWMGFGRSFQDFKINVHIAGRAGPEGIRDTYKRLSPTARNCITIENEENAWGLDDCLSLADLLPIVLDIHHHWVNTGEYIDPQDARVQRVVESWRDVRPTLHYSISREDILVAHNPGVRPDLAGLLERGYKKQHLRAHSDFYWNSAVNEWAATHTEWADIMCESKGKNLASMTLVNCQ